MFINLTPHEVKVFDENQVLIKTIPPSGQVARLEKRDGEVTKVLGVTLKRPHFGEVQNLLDPQEGVYLIVSSMVRTSPGLLSRTDLVSPGDLVRDNSGNVIGCRSFDRN